VVVLAPVRDVDSSISPVLERMARAQLREGRKLLALDLGKSEIVTSLGLAVLLRIDKAASQSGGALVLYGLRPTVAEILEKTRLDTVLTVRGDSDQAFAELRERESL
jgi:anti-anti-sigma factor